jgi:hypothetical protein
MGATDVASLESWSFHYAVGSDFDQHVGLRDVRFVFTNLSHFDSFLLLFSFF